MISVTTTNMTPKELDDKIKSLEGSIADLQNKNQELIRQIQSSSRREPVREYEDVCGSIRNV